jgi:molybdate transport system substrate-binding protein
LKRAGERASAELISNFGSRTNFKRNVMKLSRRLFVATISLASLLTSAQAFAGSVNVAVAANFTEPAKEIAAAFKAKTGHDAVLSFGASGQFFTQIKQNAPFGIMLSADEERPKKLVDEGFGVASSRFTYAIGKLVLWSKDPNTVKGEDTLKAATFNKLSIANPTAAPYGAAAVETLKALNLYATLEPKLVKGNSIGQAFQFVDTGNAELGFVALSQLMPNAGGSRWMIPQNLYTEIKQDAVLLKSAEHNEAATAFLTFLKSPESRAVIEKFGYALDPKSAT